MIIPLTRGHSCTVDDADADLVCPHKWFLLTGNNGGPYAYNGRIGMMHRLIVDAKDKDVVDHIDKNTLNNSRSNLRIVSHAQNLWNRKLQGGKCPNKTGYRGTFFNKAAQRWFSAIAHYGRTIYLGRFLTMEAAALAYDQAAYALRGDMAILNFGRPAEVPESILHRIRKAVLVLDKAPPLPH